MEFRNLKKQYLVLKNEIDEAICDVINNTNFIDGDKVDELETELANYVGVKHCITCGNGTDALSLALMTWNIGEGDAVFVPDFTFFATGEVVAYNHAVPVFVDVYEDTYNINVELLEKKIQEVISGGELVPKVIIAVDLFGQPADYVKLREVAYKYNMKILEDSAQGFGGMIHNKKAGSFGDIATTSFFPAKPLGSYGDGGAIFTDNDEWAEVLQSLHMHGKGSGKYDNIRIGINSRLDTLQAAILLPKLHAFIKYERDIVNQIAIKYSECIKDEVKVPIIRDGYISSWAQYTVQIKEEAERDSLRKYLSENGIPSMVYYPKPLHMQRAFKNTRYISENNAISERLCKTVLSLPMHPYLEANEQEKIIKKIKEYYNNNDC
ncbi:DegT/DnrJ/EryC1/StrS family aminotransferase [Lachnotalea glycerini]|uniref:DegT/DnrJ/EryC1/StrS family aminotransferase n=1 Tax=Lachnotalea glycerini TaxID=1763509 RepID=A0A371JG59_9FIRM|nr:DegT/DnrJ/EryC1/StrS family aminotransferase [Lachnotalea glycerini]